MNKDLILFGLAIGLFILSFIMNWNVWIPISGIILMISFYLISWLIEWIKKRQTK